MCNYIEKIRNIILILLLIVAAFVANSCAPSPSYAKAVPYTLVGTAIRVYDAKLQLDAQTQKLGLWFQDKPTPPWVWRRN